MRTDVSRALRGPFRSSSVGAAVCGTVRIKMCGIRTTDDVAILNEVMPEYAGFICCPRFGRYVEPGTASALTAGLDPSITAVGVFVDQPVEEVAAVVARASLGMVQLHGSEDEDYIARLRTVVDVPLVKAFVVHGASDVAAAIASSADYLLLDGGQGSGTAFDWSLARGIDRPFFLAGGLDAGNVGAALAACGVHGVRPFAVDVSSGIEVDKRKSLREARAFASAARAST